MSLSRIHWTPGSRTLFYESKSSHDGPLFSHPKGESLDIFEFIARVLTQIPQPRKQRRPSPTQPLTLTADSSYSLQPATPARHGPRLSSRTTQLNLKLRLPVLCFFTTSANLDTLN